LLGAEVEVLVSTFEGKKDNANGRISGRARDGRLVHVAVEDVAVGAGDSVTSAVTYAAPHHLVADGGITDHRAWRGPSAQAHAPAAQPSGSLLTIGRRPE
jgi:tRNA-2-methylthio-N6-dimethylallyladenosine synthase